MENWRGLLAWVRLLTHTVIRLDITAPKIALKSSPFRDAFSKSDLQELDLLMTTPGGPKRSPNSNKSPYLLPTPKGALTPGFDWGGDDAKLLQDEFSYDELDGSRVSVTPALLSGRSVSKKFYAAPPSTISKMAKGASDTPRVFFKNTLTGDRSVTRHPFDEALKASASDEIPFSKGLTMTPARCSKETGLVTGPMVETPKSPGISKNLDQSTYHIEALCRDW